jgi:hypothetical protein
MKDERLSGLLRHAEGLVEKTFVVTPVTARRAAKRQLLRWQIAGAAVVALVSIGLATLFVVREKISGL